MTSSTSLVVTGKVQMRELSRMLFYLRAGTWFRGAGLVKITGMSHKVLYKASFEFACHCILFFVFASRIEVCKANMSNASRGGPRGPDEQLTT
jgi:hypothetical protein